jgi:TM2 domain-containing membrane protein YozV
MIVNEENAGAAQPQPYQPPLAPEAQAYQAPGAQPGYQAPGTQAYQAPGAQPGYQAAPQPGPSDRGAGQPQANYGYAPPATSPLGSTAAYAQPTTGIGSPQKDKWVAAVLAYILGWAGLHKFYLGYKNEGIIMLVISIVGAICTFGLGMIVMVVIAWIEAVRYLILTQEDFQARYVIGRKGWL